MTYSLPAGVAIEPIDGGITAPADFRTAGVACGIKKADALDLARIVADGPATAAGVFTTNKAQAAPVVVSREHLAQTGGHARAIMTTDRAPKEAAVSVTTAGGTLGQGDRARRRGRDEARVDLGDRCGVRG